MDKLLGAWAEGQIDAFFGAEKISRAGEVSVFDIGEKQGRAPEGDNSAVDLGEFEIGGDGSIDDDELIFAAQ